MGCTFCATGTMGLKGNLSAGEIVEQLVHASQITPIRNIVFMVCCYPDFCFLTLRICFSGWSEFLTSLSSGN